MFWFKKKTSAKPHLQLGDDVPFVWLSNGHFSKPDWNQLKTWALSRYPQEQLADVAAAMARIWLGRLRDEAGPNFHVDETEHFLVLSAFSPTKTKMFRQFFASARQRIYSLLGELAFHKGQGPHVALILRNPAHYWEYASQYFHAQEVGAQGGVCIDQGYVHIVSYEQDAFALQTILAHEFVHSLLRHRELPLWLEEGLAEWTPMQMGLPAGHLGKLNEIAPAIRACWGKHGLREFWSGASFFAADERQEASYQLSEILLRLILDGPNYKRFDEFVAAADRGDGGEKAAQEILGYRLSERVAEFLGPGTW